MKRHILFLLAAVLGMLNIQPAIAQQTQDALYIFRNDGGFNAFFYCDIDHIAYSKVDTLGVEHDDYVTQEIYALDSIFRIPISAIDSVAFVTPEKKYKADVKLYDQTIANYIVASDSVNWFRLAANTPASMIPKKGDKLMIESESTYLPDGIAGLVESVDQSAAGYTVNLGDVVIQDIFETLVIKEGAGLSKTAAARPHENRRAADVTFNPKPIEWGPFEGSFTAQGSKDLITGWKGGIDNDFATLHPVLASEWDFERNSFIPSQVTQNDTRMVWWICGRGHHFQATVKQRVKNNKKCPYCSH